MVVSFMLRSTVASTVKNTVANSRQCIAESPNVRKKAKKSGVTPLSPLVSSGTSSITLEMLDRTIERKEFKISTLTSDDAEDLGGEI